MDIFETGVVPYFFSQFEKRVSVVGSGSALYTYKVRADNAELLMDGEEVPLFNGDTIEVIHRQSRPQILKVRRMKDVSTYYVDVLVDIIGRSITDE